MRTVSTTRLIGVAIACGGNILISLALTVQKLAHRRQIEELHRSHVVSEDGPRGEPPDHVGQNGLTAVPVVLSLNDGQQDRDGGSNATESIVEPDNLPPSLPTSGSSSPTPSPSPRALSNGTSITIKPPPPLPDGPAQQSLRQEEGKGKEAGSVEEGAYLRSKLWWLGLLLISVGEGGNFLSYGFAPASVVAPLGTVALVANCVFAPLILGERFQLRELVGMGLAILGAVTVVYASKDSNPCLDPAHLLEAIRQAPFIIYTSVNVSLIFLLILLSRSYRFGARWIGIDVGICALFGGYTVLSTKALSSLLSSLFLEAFEYPITWVLVGVLVGTSVMQIKYLNKALMRFQSKEVIPTQFVFFSLAAIVGSAVLYQEFRDVTFSNFINFAFGIATTFLGVHLLTSVSTSPPLHPSEDGDHASQRVLSVQLPPVDEHTPLLIPATPRRDSEDPTPLFSAGSVGKIRLTKRCSTGDFAPTLGLSSQAGFLLMATTPPPSAVFPDRARSLSRSTVTLAEGGLGVEEAGRRSRRSSLVWGPLTA